MTFMWKITLYYIGRTYVITRVLKWETGRQKSQNQQESIERKTQPAIADFEDGRWLQVKECRQSLEAGKTKLILPQGPQKGTQLYQCLNFSSVKPILNF